MGFGPHDSVIGQFLVHPSGLVLSYNQTQADSCCVCVFVTCLAAGWKLDS